MLHLFNKVYLELDDKIELNLDRAVIGPNGVVMANDLTGLTQGELVHYSTSFPTDFVNFITKLRAHGTSTGKKIVVYADKENYKKFIVTWFKTILPNLDETIFNKIIELTVFKERVISNTQLQTVSSLNMTQLWEGLGDFDFDGVTVTDEERAYIKMLNLNLSYEYLLADHFSGSTNYTSKLNTTVHMFLKRWFKELFTDNREMVLMNLNNKSFQDGLGYTQSDVDFSATNPLSGITGLESYADDEIWDKTTDLSSGVYGICKLEGLSDTKIAGLRTLIKKVFADVEGMEINRTMFSILDYLELAAKETITDTEMNTVLDFVVANPFDTALVPKFDFQNVNYVMINHILNLKRDNDTASLTKFSLL